MVIVLVVVVVVAVVAFLLLKKKPEQPGTTTSADAPRTLERPRPEHTAANTKAASERAPAPKAASERPTSSREETTSTTGGAAHPSDHPSMDPGTGSIPPESQDQGDVSPPPPPSRTSSKGSAETLGRPAELQSLRKGLAKSRNAEGFFGRLKGLFGGEKEIDPEIAEEIEEILLTSDVGVATTETILDRIKDSLGKGELKNEGQVWDALREEARRTLSVDGKSGGIVLSNQPTVVLLVGVNGAGKTTTIGKLAQQFIDADKKVMLAAGDTFRAAAVDQLKAWGDRVGCEVVSGKEGADPSSVLFDAIQAAKDRGVDVLLADTAGRLHTKTNLMQEMSKISKTVGKALPGAPHEVLLVIDSTNGQNAMAQAREFKEALDITGLVLTKLDGTARGGAVLGICDGLQVPVRYIGVGERTEDLYEFDTNAFVEALLGGDDEEIAA
jgi:fused signal recognition particle receptor